MCDINSYDRICDISSFSIFYLAIDKILSIIIRRYIHYNGYELSPKSQVYSNIASSVADDKALALFDDIH